jgi:hypothetical protein
MEIAKIRWFSYGAAILAVALIGSSLFVARNPKVVAERRGIYVSPEGNGQAH